MAMPFAEEFEAEEPVIEAIRCGDRYAFEEFVRRRNRWVRGVIFGVLGSQDCVDDVSQQVWTAVWQRIGELRDSRRWRSWLYRLARNAAVDAGRAISRRRNELQRVATDKADKAERADSSSPDVKVVLEEQHREVLAAIQSLPVIYREPFVLRHVNGWTYREIGEVMGLPIDSVETRLVRARRLLRESLKDRIA